MKVWVLTYRVNEYDQMDDNYFLAVFKNKPTRRQIAEHLATSEEWGGETITHILNGGGRMKSEYQWYFLNQVELEE